jgi:hypothetical protein
LPSVREAVSLIGVRSAQSSNRCFPPPTTTGNREQPELVDETFPEQRADQGGAAGDRDVLAVGED